jgi:hypothetical protein
VPKYKRSGTPSAASSTSRLPEPLVFFIDESLDNLVVVEALRDAGARVKRLTEEFTRGIQDEVWLQHAGARGWIVLTRDKRIRYRQLERSALTAAKVRAFVFTGGNVTMKDTAALLVKSLPGIRKVCAYEPGPFIYHIGQGAKPIRMS